MAKIPIPSTLGRLSQTCDIYGTDGGNLETTTLINQFLNSNDAYSSSAVDPIAYINGLTAVFNILNKLGSVEKITITSNREVERIFSLGTHSFEPYRVIPKNIKTTLTLSKVMLNNADFLSALGFPGYNIYHQQTPFIIKQTLIDPANDKENIIIVYFDCWLAENPMTFDVSESRNILVKQNVRVECGRIFVAGASIFSGLATRKKTRKDIRMR